jgi:hypothetical protein
MKNIIIILILCFSNILTFGQKVNADHKEAAKPFVLGVIDEIQSKELSERRILNIYLPEGYNPKDTINYPVIYLLDGSADEDFIHIVGLVQFNSIEWIKQVPKSIVVGIANVDRRRILHFPQQSRKTRKYIQQQDIQINLFLLSKKNCSLTLRLIIKQLLQKPLSGNRWVGF